MRDFINKWYLCYYLPHNSEDYLTGRILDFKEGRYTDIWLDLALDHLINVSPKVQFQYIIRALGSSELEADGSSKPLDKLGHFLADGLKSQFIPEILYKTKKTRPFHTLKTKAERVAEIQGVFKIHKEKYNISDSTILLIDDVQTSGTITDEILEVLNNEYKGIKPYLFTLGKTSYDPNPNEGSSIIEKFTSAPHENGSSGYDKFRSFVGVVKSLKRDFTSKKGNRFLVVELSTGEERFIFMGAIANSAAEGTAPKFITDVEKHENGTYSFRLKENVKIRYDDVANRIYDA